MSFFGKAVSALYISAFFIVMAVLLGLMNIHSLSGLLSNIGILWLFSYVLGELYFMNL